MKRGILLVLILVVCSLSVNAATFYVSKAGSDSNGGTSWGDAWLTINKAENSATADSIIYVADGTYVEHSYAGSTYPQLVMDSTANNRTFISFNKSKAIIMANTTSTSEATIVFAQSGEVTFRDFEINGNNSIKSCVEKHANGVGLTHIINNTIVNCSTYGGGKPKSAII
jgi:hypothetical protein